MNANELADLIGLCGDGGYNQDAATMLRQQADLIRNLQKSLGFKNSGYETINLTPPVAWINLDRFKDEALYLADCVSENKVENMGITTPLYTHPAKTLTDEEIGDFIHRMVLCCQVHPSSADINVLGLKFIVEDILRKAQEK